MRPIFTALSPRGARGRLSVLIFHRVTRRLDPLFPDEIDASRFDRLLGWIAHWFNVMPLDQAVRALAEGRLPPRALSITFDDGYADNHDVALPILMSHGLCATFFIAMDFLDGGRMWNDTVVEAIRATRCTTIDLAALGLPDIGTMPVHDLESRRRAIDSVLRAAKYLPAHRRLAVVEAVAHRSGVCRLPDDLMMCGRLRHGDGGARTGRPPPAAR